MTLKERAKKLKQDIPTVFLSLKDKESPILAKIVAGITVGYALSPIDLIPDFIPILGYLDDVIILPAFVSLTIKMIPQNVWERNADISKNIWKDGKPKKWYYAIPIVLFWILILLPISIITMIFVFKKTENVIGSIGGILCGIQLIPLIGAIIPTEKALKNTFDKAGNKR